MAIAPALGAQREPVSLDAFAALPRPAPSASFAYGSAPNQRIELFTPQGRGPHPVVNLRPWRLLDEGGGRGGATAPPRRPSGAHTVLVHGVLDRLVAPHVAHDHWRAVRASGGSADLVLVPDASHFDLVVPGTPAWEVVVERIEAALAR